MAQFMRPTEINFNSNKFGKRKKCENPLRSRDFLVEPRRKEAFAFQSSI